MKRKKFFFLLFFMFFLLVLPACTDSIRTNTAGKEERPSTLVQVHGMGEIAGNGQYALVVWNGMVTKQCGKQTTLVPGYVMLFLHTTHYLSDSSPAPVPVGFRFVTLRDEMDNIYQTSVRIDPSACFGKAMPMTLLQPGKSIDGVYVFEIPSEVLDAKPYLQWRPQIDKQVVLDVFFTRSALQTTP